jgi:hypothetical protein
VLAKTAPGAQPDFSVKADTSSATGVMQFTENTFLNLAKQPSTANALGVTPDMTDAQILELRKARFEASQKKEETTTPPGTGTEETSIIETAVAEDLEKDPNGLWGETKPTSRNLWSDDDGSPGSNNRGPWN